eukprot:UN12929
MICFSALQVDYAYVPGKFINEWYELASMMDTTGLGFISYSDDR